MKIEKIHIKKFRGFKDEIFSLGQNLTAIIGQNGTQKTTLLGLLSQPFSISIKDHPMYGEKPLCGGNFKSGFAEKFKLSEEFDKPKNHEWSLYISEKDEPFTLESIKRDKSEDIRFWKKGDKSKGSGYLPLPVIYLSLSRLFPLGEDPKIDIADIDLTDDEINFCINWHRKILIILDEIKKSDYLESTSKNTLGISTEFYDWKQNSAGQDNIGKILLAILSFKRLKKKYPQEYLGGILAIDEIDSTLYPASQEKLIDALCKFSSEYNLQIIFTTHSLEILKHLDKKPIKQKERNKVIFLKKKNSHISILEDPSFQDIISNLNVIDSGNNKEEKLRIFSEDDEARCFIKQILGSSITRKLDFINSNIGGDTLIHLAKNKIPGFNSPESIVILDGDKKVSNFNNFISLPGDLSPERLLAEYLYKLEDDDMLWENLGRNYTKQVCFRDITIEEIRNDREKAKAWFIELKKSAGRNACKVINPWKRSNQEEVNKFIKCFVDKYNKIATIRNLTPINLKEK